MCIRDRKDALPLWVKDVLYNRIAFVKEKQIQAKALWIDDKSSNNKLEQQLLQSFGLSFDIATSSEAGMQLLSTTTYDLMLSNIARGENTTEGIQFLPKLVRRKKLLPTIFYIGNYFPSKGVPPYAFGIANRPDELIHLVLDVLERKY